MSNATGILFNDAGNGASFTSPTYSTQRRDLDAVLTPLVGADQTLQPAQRGDIRLYRHAISLGASGAHIGRAAQRDAVAGLERQ